jgi:hypothetical protein
MVHFEFGNSDLCPTDNCVDKGRKGKEMKIPSDRDGVAWRRLAFHRDANSDEDPTLYHINIVL